MILNNKEQSTSQNVASSTIEVKKLKRKSTHIKEKSRKPRDLV